MIPHQLPVLRATTVAASVAVLSFGVFGTVAALWPNPLFIRMTPAGGWEIGLLALQSVLLGLFAAIWQPTCSVRTAGVGGVLNFLGIACPVCNKVLLLLFGWSALMTYFEPLRPYLALVGVLITALALRGQWISRRTVLSTGASSPVISPVEER